MYLCLYWFFFLYLVFSYGISTHSKYTSVSPLSMKFISTCQFTLTIPFITSLLEKALESPLDCKEIQPVHPKGDQSWVFIGRLDAEAETPIIWSPDMKSWLIWKDPDAGKDWGQEKGMTEDEMVGWHHWLNEHEFEQAPGVGDGQRSLACCSPWGCKESDTTESLNWIELMTFN